ncbi:MAG: IS3 family transposase, partial [Candidatus Paceibacterales bacterium]
MDHRSKLNLIVPDHPSLSVARQTQLLDISRASVYYQPVVDPEDVRLMGCMDKIFTKYPFYGSRKIKHELESEPYNISVCREHVQRLMRLMGLEAIYPKKKITIPNQQHLKYPYLLKNLPIIRPNQVWGTDITYIKLLNGFCYLVALLDWFSRYVIAWGLSDSLNINFCLANLQTALKINIP